MKHLRYSQPGNTHGGGLRYSQVRPSEHTVQEPNTSQAEWSGLLKVLFWGVVNIGGALIGAFLGLVLGILFFWLVMWIAFRGEFRERR